MGYTGNIKWYNFKHEAKAHKVMAFWQDICGCKYHINQRCYTLGDNISYHQILGNLKEVRDGSLCHQAISNHSIDYTG